MQKKIEELQNQNARQLCLSQVARLENLIKGKDFEDLRGCKDCSGIIYNEPFNIDCKGYVTLADLQEIEDKKRDIKHCAWYLMANDPKSTTFMGVRQSDGPHKLDKCTTCDGIKIYCSNYVALNKNKR